MDYDKLIKEVEDIQDKSDKPDINTLDFSNNSNTLDQKMVKIDQTKTTKNVGQEQIVVPKLVLKALYISK